MNNIADSAVEPTEAFPYSAPTDYIKSHYSHIFEIEEALPGRFFKTLFDKVVSAILLTFSLPVLLLKIAYVIAVS